MIPGWKDYLAVQQHFDEFRREAEVERLLRSGLARGERQRLSISQAIVWLGRRMPSLGKRVQTRNAGRSQMPDCLTGEC